MRTFAFTTASAVADALAQNGGHPENRFVAGGTTLLDLMKLEVETPSQLIDIHRLPLSQIEETSDGGVRIGAMASNSAVAHHKLIEKQYPLLSEALLSGASPQLRNMATVGGNLLQRTRCTYFRDPHWACNKRTPGSGCAAQEGYHRHHAIFGVSDQCFATHPSDMAVALVALDAEVEIESAKGGTRRVPVREFHLLPGSTPQIETVLKLGELITAVYLPKLDGKWRAQYLKVRDRESYEFALVSVAAMLQLDGKAILEARIAFGGVGTKPWRAPAVESALQGGKPGRELFSAAAAQSVIGAETHPQNAYKVELLQRAIVRVLEQLTGEEHKA